MSTRTIFGYHLRMTIVGEQSPIDLYLTMTSHLSEFDRTKKVSGALMRELVSIQLLDPRGPLPSISPRERQL